MATEPTDDSFHDEVKRVTLRIFSSHDAANIARSNLEAHGIECWVNADDCAGWYTNLTAPGGVLLLVRASDVEAAMTLLDAEASPTEIKQIETEAVTFPTPKPASLTQLSFGQMLFGVAVGIILCLLYQWSGKLGTKKFSYRTAEGKDYGGIEYRDGHAVKSIIDRNLDGIADEWIYYQNDQIVRLEYDDNFDTKRDLFVTYSNNLPTAAEGDTDFNGVPDVFESYNEGVLKQVDFRPNGLKHTTIREIFQNGVLTEIWRGGDSNGNFKEVVRYDPFFNPISTNIPAPFELLSPAAK